MKSKRYLTLGFLVLALVLALHAFTGCGKKTSPYQESLNQMKSLSGSEMGDNSAAVGALNLVDGETSTDEDIMDKPEERSLNRSRIEISWSGEVYGLAFTGSWDTVALTGDVTVVGTISGHPNPFLNGTVVDLAKHSTVNSNHGTITISGTVTTPQEVVYAINSTKTLTYDDVNHILTLNIDTDVTQNDVSVYDKNVTWSVDWGETPDPVRTRTVTGYVQVHSLIVNSSFIRIQYNDLQYKPVFAGGYLLYRDFLAGGVTITNEILLTADLAAQPADCSLFGYITNASAENIATMKIDNGVVTILIL